MPREVFKSYNFIDFLINFQLFHEKIKNSIIIKCRLMLFCNDIEPNRTFHGAE